MEQRGFSTRVYMQFLRNDRDPSNNRGMASAGVASCELYFSVWSFGCRAGGERLDGLVQAFISVVIFAFCRVLVLHTASLWEELRLQRMLLRERGAEGSCVAASPVFCSGQAKVVRRGRWYRGCIVSRLDGY